MQNPRENLTLFEVRQLTEQQRLDRIGELLFNAALSYCRKQQRLTKETRQSEQPAAMQPSRPSAEYDSEIVQYLMQAGPAAPRDIRLALGLSRTTANRRLTELVHAGRIVATGRTHMLLYSVKLPRDPSAN